MALILEVVRGRDTSQSLIMRYANVNHKQLKKYLQYLTDMGFIEANAKNEQVAYKTTEKGINYLRQYYVLLGMLMNAYAQSSLAQIIR
jgi:predicted transcriptional regulator